MSKWIHDALEKYPRSPIALHGMADAVEHAVDAAALANSLEAEAAKQGVTLLWALAAIFDGNSVKGLRDIATLTNGTEPHPSLSVLFAKVVDAIESVS